jgi:hypothetical protein
MAALLLGLGQAMLERGPLPGALSVHWPPHTRQDVTSMETHPVTMELEVLPVFLDAGRIYWLRPRGQESWRLHHDISCMVRDSVCRGLAAVGAHVDLIHSTSWRQERTVVLLTHLATLQRSAARPAGFEPRRASRRDLARASALLPPGAIDVEQVVEHALRHLAWLALEDPAVGGALEPAWQEPLSEYRPEPCRMFERL